MTQEASFKRRQLGLRNVRERHAVRRARGRMALRERDRAWALGELSRGIGVDYDASLRMILKFDADALLVERVSFWSLSAMTSSNSSIHCDAGYVARAQAYEGGMTIFASQAPEYFEAIREERALDIGNVRTDPRAKGLREYCAARHISSMLDIPVWVEGRLLGVLCHEHVGAPRRWTAKEAQFAASMGQFIASALAARGQTVVEIAAQRAAFLSRFSAELTSLDRSEVQRKAVAFSLPLLGDLSLLWLRSPEGVFDCVALSHVDPHMESSAREIASALGPQKESLHRYVVTQGQSLLIPAITPATLRQTNLSELQRAFVAEFGLRTAMAVPLTVAGKTFGAMSFFARDRHFDADDLALAENAVTRVATALENARLYQVSRDATRARDDLLVLAAHELRTPLTALELATRNLQRRTGTSDPRLVGSIARQSYRLRALVDRVIAALNIRAQGVTLDLAPCDLVTIVQERVNRIADPAESAGSRLSVALPRSMVGRWDSAHLETVFDALLDNAVKFGSGQPIDVTARVDGQYAEVAIRDEGVGVSPHRLASIFEPLERAVLKEQFAGLGLGLYIAKAIVDAHGGSIDVTSWPDHGSTFVVRLPMRAEVDSRQESHQAT